VPTRSIGVKLGGLVPERAPTLVELVELAVELERIGADGIVDSEHILFTEDMPHPGGSGKVVHERTSQLSNRGDPLMMLTAIAARTTTLELFIGVLLGAGHSFAVLAKQCSTLDVLSKGRFSLGVASGWHAPEFRAMGIPPKERDERLEEIILACRELWSPGRSHFEGRWINFDGVFSEPAPVTPGGVPVWWGGNALKGPTARRVATLGEGWTSREAAGYDEITESIEHISKVCVEHGRDPSTVGFRTALSPTPADPTRRPAGEVIEEALANHRTLEAAGVTHFTIPLDFYELELDDLGVLIGEMRA
jgi:probable F420-dependent oxidoreductase